MVMVLGGSGTANGITSFSSAAAFASDLTINRKAVVNYAPATTDNAAIYVATANTQGGIGYADFLKIQNTSHPAVTNPNKTFRLNSTGGIEVINSAYTANLLTLDDSGRVMMPYQPRFRAYINSSADTTYTINTILPFNATSYNVGSHFNTSTYLFTAPIAGYYYFHSATYGTSSGGAATMALRWYINGVSQSIASTSDVNIGTGAGQISIAPVQHSVVFYLNANDTVGTYCTAYNGINIFRIFTGASIFEGYLLG